MTVREILSATEETLETFDYFNDFQDTVEYLKGVVIYGPMEERKRASEIAEKLRVGYDQWFSEKEKNRTKC